MNVKTAIWTSLVGAIIALAVNEFYQQWKTRKQQGASGGINV